MSCRARCTTRHGGTAWRGREIVRRRRSFSLPVAALLFCVVTLVGTAPAEDDLVGEATDQPASRRVRFAFDDQVNAMLGGGDRPVEAARRNALDARLLEVDYLDRICRLDEAQARTCRVAARIEASRTTEALERIIARYGGRTIDFDNPEDQQLWHRFHQEFTKIRSSMGRSMTRNGLLSRVLENTLDDRQRSAWEEESERRRRRQWRVGVGKQMRYLQQMLGLTSAQHEALEALMLEKVPAFDLEVMKREFGGGHEGLGRMAMVRLDRQRVAAILDARQMELFGPMADQFVPWEATLRGMGALGK